MKAFLFDHQAEIVVVYDVLDGPPPKILAHGGKRFDWSGSSARLTDDGVEHLGWDYMQQFDGRAR